MTTAREAIAVTVTLVLAICEMSTGTIMSRMMTTSGMMAAPLRGSAARPIAVQGRADDDEQDEDDAPLFGPKVRLLAALQKGSPQPSSAC